MKKLLLLVAFLAAARFSYSNGYSETAINAKTLDDLWSQFFSSGDSDAVRKIIKVIDWPDFILQDINLRLKEEKDALAKKYLVSLLEKIGISLNSTQEFCITNVDIEIAFGLMLHGNNEKESIFALLELIDPSNKLLYRSAIKSAAFMSVVAKAREHGAVKKIVVDTLDSLKWPSRNMLHQALEQ